MVSVSNEKNNNSPVWAS